MKVTMASYVEDLVKCGFLEMKLPRKQRKLTHKIWKRKWFVLRRKSPRGQPRLEYYLTEKACSEGRHRTSISLEDLTSVSHAHSRTHNHSFLLVGMEIKLFLSADTEKESLEWIQLIKELVLPEPKLYPSVQAGDIYGLHEVNVIPTEDSDRLELTGNYLMTVRKEYLCLHSAKTGERVLEWELDHLPRFRLQRLSHLQDLDKVLTFQAGRGCKTGEGHFQFLTQRGREILDCVKLQTQKLANMRQPLPHERHRRPSIDSVPCTRSSENETVDSLTSNSFS
ncbi:docking protein 6-like [Pocillopora damicornis]|uniref:docking protein 6-like n=1 Tax=Pocillopora damicornis TaxID=46731 RepID=UPI000F551599|nr:docking protein 6-like [Pocillopora damicornis]